MNKENLLPVLCLRILSVHLLPGRSRAADPDPGRNRFAKSCSDPDFQLIRIRSLNSWWICHLFTNIFFTIILSFHIWIYGLIRIIEILICIRFLSRSGSGWLCKGRIRIRSMCTGIRNPGLKKIVMVLISDGCSELGSHVGSNICYLTC